MNLFKMKHLPLISLLILLVHFCNGQPTNDNKSTTALPLNRSKNPVTLSFGLEINRPFALKDSYLNKAQKLNRRLGFEFDGILFDYILRLKRRLQLFPNNRFPYYRRYKQNKFVFNRYKLGVRIPFEERWAVDVVYYLEEETRIRHSLNGGSRELQ